MYYLLTNPTGLLVEAGRECKHTSHARHSTVGHHGAPCRSGGAPELQKSVTPHLGMQGQPTAQSAVPRPCSCSGARLPLTGPPFYLAMHCGGWCPKSAWQCHRPSSGTTMAPSPPQGRPAWVRRQPGRLPFHLSP